MERVVKTLFAHRRKENVQFRWTIVYLNSSFKQHCRF